MKKTFSIIKGKREYVFRMKDEDMCWYSFDHAEAKLHDGTSMKINADREVYVTWTSEKGFKYAGVVKDDDDNILPDNVPVDAGYKYHFVRCKAGYYI